MSTVREMRGVTDLTGSTNKEGQRITRMVSRRPLAWELNCTRCGTSQFPVAHAKAQYATCRNNTCGQSLSSRRATLATTSAVVPAIRSRDSESTRQFHEEEAELERVAEEQRSADAAKREEEKRQSVRERQRKFVAESVAAGPDPLFAGVDPETIEGRISVPVNQVGTWNKNEADKFKQNCPDYCVCPENFEALAGYLERNAPGLVLVSAKQLEAAFRRLQSLGLLKEHPVVTSQPEPEKSKATAVNLEIAPPSDPNSPDAVVDGWDLESGAPRKWANRELDKLSSTDYRRALRLYSTVGAIVLGQPGADRRLVAAGKELR